MVCIANGLAPPLHASFQQPGVARHDSSSLFVLVTQTIGVFQVFVVILLLTVNGGPANATRTVVYGMYETAFTPMYDFDYAAAQGSLLLVALGTIAVVQFRLLGRQTTMD